MDGSRPFYRCYECADGGHVAVGALEPQFYAQLLQGLGIEPDRFIQYDPAGWPGMEATFAAAFLTRTRDAWEALFADTDACVSPVLSFGEAVDHPHNRERGMCVVENGVNQPAPAPRFSVTTAMIESDRRGSISIDDALSAWSR